MKKKKLILITALFLAMTMLLSGCGNAVVGKETEESTENISQDNTLNINDGDGFITDTAKYYRTAERNFEGGSTSRAVYNQEQLFYEGDLIFKGTYLFNENYTLEYDRHYELDNKNSEIYTFIEYYTYYKFLVTNVYKGDKSLENTEIYLAYRNLPDNENTVLLQNNEDYFMFVEYYNADANNDFYKERYGVPPFMKTDYRAMLIQGTFPIKDNNVYSSKELMDYDDIISKNRNNVFMNNWIEKQNNEKNLSISDKNLEVDSVDLDINDMVKDWCTDLIKTINGSTERIGIPFDLFIDFLNSAIEYYNVNYYNNMFANNTKF